ncbi:MAG: hypothetical protein GQF41_4506 [Candidatus Rifleibacterium amylolyticum]|nr:MAG: hypothetical protein GQF41_4506 [Candidatus Rifleibacterium amylolyticum]
MTTGSKFLTDVEVEVIPLSCVQHLHHNTRMLQDISFLQEETNQVVIGGGCLQGSDLHALKLSGNFVLAPSQCFYLIAPAPILDGYISEGAYLMTPGWLLHWDRHLRELGFEKEGARQFFQESVSMLVLLDTGVDKEVSSKLAAMAEYLALPFKIVAVGLDLLRLNLENLYMKVF